MCSKVITLLLKHVISVSWFSLQLACTCTEYSNPCPTRNQCIRRPLYPIPSRNCKNIRRDESLVGHTSGATRLVSPLQQGSAEIDVGERLPTVSRIEGNEKHDILDRQGSLCPHGRRTGLEQQGISFGKGFLRNASRLGRVTGKPGDCDPHLELTLKLLLEPSHYHLHLMDGQE